MKRKCNIFVADVSFKAKFRDVAYCKSLLCSNKAFCNYINGVLG